MEIKQYVWDVVDSNSWLVTEENRGLLVDAIDSEELTIAIKKLDELTIVLTHSHFDHIYGLNKIRKIRPDAKVLSTRLCSENLGNIYRNMSSSANVFIAFYSGRKDIKIEPFRCDPSEISFENELSFIWNEHKIQLLSFHGHTLDSLIAIIDEKLLFSGDTLLSIPTVTRFPGGSTEKFWMEDVPRLQALNEIKMVYPGHRKPGNLKDMLSINKLPSKYR